VIVFTSDHGEMGGAHGGQIEKWHNAYRETLHVPLVVSSPLVNPSPDIMVDIDKVTSHIDLLPTLLGLAGYDKANQAAVRRQRREQARITELAMTKKARLRKRIFRTKISNIQKM
jgi:arylsulfatase A-like enzyme